MTSDIYANITQSVIAAMETATGDYTCPWHTPAASQSPRNAVSKHYYRGANVIALWISTLKCGFDHSLWATYKQWQQVEGQVRQGEKGSRPKRRGGRHKAHPPCPPLHRVQHCPG